MVLDWNWNYQYAFMVLNTDGAIDTAVCVFVCVLVRERRDKWGKG